MSNQPSSNSEQSSNRDPEQSAPVEEMIPLVKPQAEPQSDTASEQAASEQEEQRPPTPEEMDRHECRTCGNTYEPAKGDSRNQIPRGVPFDELAADWRCPVCGANKGQYKNIGPQGKASGFQENLSYGFGVNTLTPGQKNVLIFGALGIAVLFFLSLYGLQ